MCQPTVALAVAAMEAMQAVSKPFDPGVYPTMTASQTCAVRTKEWPAQNKRSNASGAPRAPCAHSRIALIPELHLIALLAPLIAVAGFWATLDPKAY